MRYSAALLVKQTCRQINYHYRKALQRISDDVGGDFVANSKNAGPTPQQQAGDAWAASKHVKGNFREMRGQFHYHNDIIYYCFDEVHRSLLKVDFIEHKMPTLLEGSGNPHEPAKRIDDSHLEYLEQSLIQVAFYAALWNFSYRELKPAQHSPEVKTLLLNFEYGLRSRNFFLEFGGTSFKVVVTSPNMVARFYLTKLRAARDWSKSAKFDKAWKGKEWSFFSEHLKLYIKKNGRWKSVKNVKDLRPISEEILNSRSLTQVPTTSV